MELNETPNQEQTPILKEMFVTDLDAVRALTDPLKMKILEAIGPEPRTVKQLAASLKMVPNNLYYHINQLENLKLVRVVNTRVVSGIIEKQYAAAALSYTFSRSLMSQHNPDKEAINEAMNNRVMVLIESIKDEMEESVKAGLFEPPLHAMMILNRNNFTQAQVELMHSRLQEIINLPEFADCEDPNQPDAHAYRVMFNLFPLVEHGTEEVE